MNRYTLLNKSSYAEEAMSLANEMDQILMWNDNASAMFSENIAEALRLMETV